MRVPRTNELLDMLEAYAIGEITLPPLRVNTAVKLLELSLYELWPPNGGGTELPGEGDNVVEMAQRSRAEPA